MLELPDRRIRGRSQRRFTNVAKEAMQRFGVTVEDVRDRVRRRQMMHSGNP